MKKFLYALLLLINSPAPLWHSAYYPTIDLSTGCESFPVLESMVAIQRDGQTLALAANPANRGGVYTGAIAAGVFTFTDNTTYTLTGSFRKASGNPEQIDVNIQWVDENYLEHYAEILWTLNPHSPLYGWIWTRNGSDPIRLYKLGDDTQWHAFKITALHTGDVHTIQSITIDGHSFLLNVPEGVMSKTYSNRLTVLLEIQNGYTNCDSRIASQAVAEFQGVLLQSEYNKPGKQ